MLYNHSHLWNPSLQVSKINFLVSCQKIRERGREREKKKAKAKFSITLLEHGNLDQKKKKNQPSIGMTKLLVGLQGTARNPWL